MPLSLFIASFTISLLHAAMPTHWLTIALISRMHQWNRLKLFLMALLASICHMLGTLILGLVAWAIGKAVITIFSATAKYIVASVLLFIGILYLVKAMRKHTAGNICTVETHKTEMGEHAAHRGEKSAWLTFGALLLALTLSPCQAILPLFFAAAPCDAATLIALMLFTAAVTIFGMTSLVMLASFGLELLRLPISERLEMTAAGLLFIAIAPLAFYH